MVSHVRGGSALDASGLTPVQWRLLVIVYRLLPFAVAFRRDFRRWIFFGAPAIRTPADHERRATQLVASLAELGPTFVKGAQLFAGRSDILLPTYARALTSLTDQVPMVALAEVERIIVEEYGAPAHELFERFDVLPLAAASLGQVHRATYEGRDVVVKVLRPGVEALVTEDVRVSLRLLDLFDRHAPGNPHVRALRTVVEQFSLHVWEEMDFRHEAANAEAIRANFAGDRNVAIPRIEAALVRQHVLVMEYMAGTRIDALGSLVAAGRLDASAVVRRVMELYIQMMLVDGLFHADPHPGNLLVADDGTLVLLDFGMVVPVPAATRRALVATAFAGIKRDAAGVVAGFHSLGVVAPGADPARIRTLVELLFVVADSHSTAMERARLLADEVMANLHDFPVELPGEMVYFARTAALIEGVGVRYDARFNAASFATPVALRMRGRIVASLREGAPPGSDDLLASLGGVLGEVAGIVANAGRQIVGLLQERIALGGVRLD